MPPRGVEPLTLWLRATCSAIELRRHGWGGRNRTSIRCLTGTRLTVRRHPNVSSIREVIPLIVLGVCFQGKPPVHILVNLVSVLPFHSTSFPGACDQIRTGVGGLTKTPAYRHTGMSGMANTNTSLAKGRPGQEISRRLPRSI